MFDNARMLFDHLRQPHKINKRRYSHLASDFFYEVSDEESDELEDEPEEKSTEKSNVDECSQFGLQVSQVGTRFSKSFL